MTVPPLVGSGGSFGWTKTVIEETPPPGKILLLPKLI